MYDVIIVGAGPSGIFAAYELTKLDPNKKVVLIDKGHDILRRNCPILDEKIVKCPPANKKKEYAGCLPACSITAGWGGAGVATDWIRERPKSRLSSHDSSQPTRTPRTNHHRQQMNCDMAHALRRVPSLLAPGN